MYGRVAKFAHYAYKNRNEIATKAGKIRDAYNKVRGLQMDSAIKADLTVKKSAVRKYLDKNYVRKCGVEVKRITDASVYTLTTTISSLSGAVTGVAQGTGETQRVGSSYELKSYTSKMIWNAVAGSVTPTYIRLFLIKVGKTSGSLPGVGTILDSNTNILSPMASLTDNKIQESFTIVKELNFVLAPYGQAGASKKVMINYRPKGCHEVKYIGTDTTGGLANQIEGALAVYGYYNGSAVPTNTINYNMLEWVDV